MSERELYKRRNYFANLKKVICSVWAKKISSVLENQKNISFSLSPPMNVEPPQMLVYSNTNNLVSLGPPLVALTFTLVIKVICLKHELDFVASLNQSL